MCDDFLEVWSEAIGTIDIPLEEQLRILLVEGWQAIKLTTKVYPLSQKDRDFVDKEFDKLYEQGWMEWTTQPTPFGFPVFVVWRTIHVNGIAQRKGRVVVDIRGLNAIASKDSYPLPLQTDIISAVQGCRYISIIDCASFFFQWLVAEEDRYKFTVVTHRGQEYFNVVILGFCNSPPYIQRRMDLLLREFRHFCRAYVDDIIVYSSTLEEHIQHLATVFNRFQGLGIQLKPSKAFIGYPSITLLGQRVDGLGLAIEEEKIRALRELQFPRNLGELK